MKPIEFNQIFAPFNDNYKNTYRANQIDHIYEYVKAMDVGKFNLILDEIMIECPRAPSMSLIKAKCKEEATRARYAERSQNLQKEPICHYCNKSGVIECWDKIKKRNVQFRCDKCECASFHGYGREYELIDWAQYQKRFMPITQNIQKRGRYIRTMPGGRLLRLTEVQKLFSELKKKNCFKNLRGKDLDMVIDAAKELYSKNGNMNLTVKILAKEMGAQNE
jgi:hypothetical protein